MFAEQVFPLTVFLLFVGMVGAIIAMIKDGPDSSFLKVRMYFVVLSGILIISETFALYVLQLR